MLPVLLLVERSPALVLCDASLTRRSRLAGRFFSTTHTFLSMACIFMGAGLKIVLVHVSESQPLAQRELWLLGGSVCGCLMLTMAVRMSHRGWRSELGLLRPQDPHYRVERCATLKSLAAAMEASAGAATSLAGTHTSSDSHTSGSLSSLMIPLLPLNRSDVHAQSHHGDGAAITSTTAAQSASQQVPTQRPCLLVVVWPAVCANRYLQRSRGRFPCTQRCDTALDNARRGVPLHLRLQHDQILRRRVLWACRLVVCALTIAWAVVVDRNRDTISALAFTGGLCFLCCTMHALDYPDIVNYSDLPAAK